MGTSKKNTNPRQNHRRRNQRKRKRGKARYTSRGNGELLPEGDAGEKPAGSRKQRSPEEWRHEGTGEMEAVTLTPESCAPLMDSSPAKPSRARPGFQRRAVPSWLTREARLEETEGARMEGWKGTKGYRQIIRDEQPNTGRVHQMEPDRPLHHPVGATNHPLIDERIWRLLVPANGCRASAAAGASVCA